MRNKIIKIFLLLAIMLTVFTTHPVYADDWHEETMIQQQLDANDPSANPDFWEPTRESDTSLKFKMKVNNLLGYINTIGTVISVLTILIVGIKYMLGSVEEKAEYKKTMVGYLIGALLLFTATTIPNILYNIGNSI